MLEKTQMSASQVPQVNVGNRLSNLAGSGWSNNSSNELTSRPGVKGNWIKRTTTTTVSSARVVHVEERIYW